MSIAWFILLTGAARLGFSEPTTDFDRASIEPGERVVVTLTYPKRSAGVHPNGMPVVDGRLLEESGLKVMAFDTFENASSYQWRWEITSHLPGTSYFPALMITDGGQTHSTERRAIEVRTSRAPNDDTLRPSFGIVAVPWNWALILKIVGVMGITSLIAGRILRRSRLPPPPAVFPTVSPEEWFRKELMRLGSQPSAARLDEYLTVLLEYFERLRPISAPSRTTAELRTYLSENVRPFLEILDRCDLFRYQIPKESEHTLTVFCINRSLCLIP